MSLKNFTRNNDLLDDSCSSSQTSNSTEKHEKSKLIQIINVLTNKLQTENEEKRDLKKIIEGQEQEIMALNRENF